MNVPSFHALPFGATRNCRVNHPTTSRTPTTIPTRLSISAIETCTAVLLDAHPPWHKDEEEAAERCETGARPRLARSNQARRSSGVRATVP